MTEHNLTAHTPKIAESEQNSKLLLNTFDGSIENIILNSQSDNTKIEIKIKYYDEKDKLTDASIVFDGVVSFDFQVNCFDNSIGSELCGFYEIFNNQFKIRMVEKIFNNRLDGFLYHNDYDYDANDANDMLNYKDHFNEIISLIAHYHLFQQQMNGGIFLILAKGYRMIF